MKNKNQKELRDLLFWSWTKCSLIKRAWYESGNGSRSKPTSPPLEVLLSSGLRYLDLIFITSFYKTNIGNKRRKEAFKDHLIYHLCDGCTGHSSHPNLPSSKNANVLLYYYYGLSKEPVTSLDCFYFVWKQWMVGQDTESAKKAKK